MISCIKASQQIACASAEQSCQMPQHAASPNAGEGQTQPDTRLTRLPGTGNAGDGWSVILLQGGMHRLKGGQASNGEEQTLMPFMAL